ncbi:MAG: Zn-ribbon domain-containing OB-fold protein [Candidatus Lokiarchaeia archaeon]
MSVYPLTYEKWAEALKEGKLLGLKCKSCGAVFSPPSMLCRECDSEDVEVTEVKDNGVIETYTVIRVAPMGYEEEAPYVVARAKMDEGFIMVGRLVGVEPEKVEIGTKVKVGFVERENGIMLTFNPV